MGLIPEPSAGEWDNETDATHLVLAVLSHFGIRNVTISVQVVTSGMGFLHGTTMMSKVKRAGVILLNARHWPFRTAQRRWEVCVHEAMHVVAIVQSWAMPEAEAAAALGDDGHGPLWVTLMESIGADPQAVVSEVWTEERVRAFMPRRKYRCVCLSEACGHRWGLTKKQAQRWVTTPMPCVLCAGETSVDTIS